MTVQDEHGRPLTGHREAMPHAVTVERAPVDFDGWNRILQLLRAAFAYQEHRIDPPSSVRRLGVASLAEKASEESLFVATVDGSLAGCVFARDRGPALYLSKLAVWPDLQGLGIGRRLMSSVEAFANEAGRAVLELETRIELTENHRLFEALGFRKISEHAHEGYDRPTYVRMHKQLRV